MLTHYNKNYHWNASRDNSLFFQIARVHRPRFAGCRSPLIGTQKLKLTPLLPTDWFDFASITIYYRWLRTLWRKRRAISHVGKKWCTGEMEERRWWREEEPLCRLGSLVFTSSSSSSQVSHPFAERIPTTTATKGRPRGAQLLSFLYWKAIFRPHRVSPSPNLSHFSYWKKSS